MIKKRLKKEFIINKKLQKNKRMTVLNLKYFFKNNKKIFGIKD